MKVGKYEIESGVNLVGANLENEYLVDADLEGIVPTDANLVSANLTRARLESVIGHVPLRSPRKSRASRR